MKSTFFSRYNTPNLFVISSFGIYLTSFGLRFEHILVYTFLLYCILELVFLKKSKQSSILIKVSFVFIIFMAYAYLLGSLNGSNILSKYVIGQIDRFTLGFSAFFVVYYFFRNQSISFLEQSLSGISKFLIVLCAIVSVLTIYSMLTGNVSIFSKFQPAADELRGNVSLRSLKMGRYTGIFGSPFESGLMYSLALFAYGYLRRINQHNFYYNTFTILIVAGGILAVSKAFILGILLFLIFVFDFSNPKKLVSSFFGVMVLVTVTYFSIMLIAPNWSGFDRLNRLLVPDQSDDVLRTYSGTRFSETGEGTIQTRYELVVESLPFGKGFGNYGVVDNAYLEILLIGGLLWFFLFVGMKLKLLIYFYKFKDWKGRVFFCQLMIYTVIASLGAPVITKNRFSVVFFTFIAIALLLRRKISLLKTHSNASLNEKVTKEFVH
ncbi:hypothetical protein [Arthrospiribacter ruber]|uniref:O-antigen ligase domain-containing protein n=1 Tax=Arthrospiribacter ruber TaxID=2487934 RepID=A0A951ITL1_9BACT|nr:hypothetical protein [Arthrospiribacter ruber]MBW3466409.1 hypothetical protein [Arthrospiribacter ruber]